MKKIVLLSLFCLLVFTSTAQLHPVKKLSLKHWYSTPNNCFELSWSAPDSSQTDTLIGYKIYRDSNFYIFTKNTSIGYNPCIGSTSNEYASFMSFVRYPFYAHVTAVYNFNRVESEYTDSAIFRGLMISVAENRVQTTFRIFPQPLSVFATLELNAALKDATIQVYNATGMLVRKMNHVDGQTVRITRGDLRSGIYFLQVFQDNQLLAKDKLIISD